MSQPNEVYAYFTITGDFDPGEITARIGLAPTECWRKGDLNPRNHLERRLSRWSLYSRLGKDRPLEEHVEDVLVQMDAKSRDLLAISREFGGRLELVGYFHSGYPGFVFERAQVAKIAEFALEVDFDFYYMYSDRREDTE